MGQQTSSITPGRSQESKYSLRMPRQEENGEGRVSRPVIHRLCAGVGVSLGAGAVFRCQRPHPLFAGPPCEGTAQHALTACSVRYARGRPVRKPGCAFMRTEHISPSSTGDDGCSRSLCPMRILPQAGLSLTVSRCVNRTRRIIRRCYYHALEMLTPVRERQ